MSRTKTLPREMNEEGRAKDGGPILPGDTFHTHSMRVTTPYPRQRAEKYASKWLIENAVAEAQSRMDSFNAKSFAATRVLKDGSLVPADAKGMLLYLFGWQPCVPPSILHPLVPTPGLQSGGSESRLWAIIRGVNNQQRVA